MQRELGLERVVKLASNEGPFGPFPAALEALERGRAGAEPLPGRRLLPAAPRASPRSTASSRPACAVPPARTASSPTSARDARPGDEVVFGWPSFPSYLLGAMKLGATPVRVPLSSTATTSRRSSAAITDRTKIVYLCNPNNPTGTMIPRDASTRTSTRVPDHVLTVLDEAYFEYLDEPDYPDGIEEYVKAGRNVPRPADLLQDLRARRAAGRATASARRRSSTRSGRCGTRSTSPSPPRTPRSRASTTRPSSTRRRAANAERRAQLVELCSRPRADACAAPAVANFVYAEVGEDARPCSTRSCARA